MSAIDQLFAGYGDHLTIDDLSKLLNIERATVYLWLNRGTIPAYRVGSRWLVLTAEVRAMIEAGRNSGPPETLSSSSGSDPAAAS